MLAKRRQTVDQWIESVLDEAVDGKGCSAIALLHMKGMGGATEEVTTKVLDGPQNVKDLANHLISRAEGFSQDLSGLQTFKLVAFYASAEPHNPFHFTISDGMLISRSEAMQTAHEPTSTGLLGQLMKHVENVSQQNSALVQGNTALALSVVNMFLGPSGFLQQARQAEQEAISVVRDAMLNMFKERKELALEEGKVAKDLQMRQALIEAVPHLANAWTGRDIFDPNRNKVAILEKLAERFTPDDVQFLVQLGKITQEEGLILANQFKAIITEKQKMVAALKEAPPENMPPTNGKGTLS